MLGLALLSTSAFAGPAAMTDMSKGKEIPVTQEETCDPRWYFSLGGGAEFNIGSSHIVNGFEEDFTAFGNIQGRIFPAPAHLAIDSRDWGDSHDAAWRGQAEIGYALTQHLEVFGRFNYSHADSAGLIDIGEVSVDLAPTVATFPLSAEFDDYSAWGSEVGFRFFFMPRQAWFRPYVALSGGATHVDNIDATILADTTGVGGPSDFLVYRGAYFDESWTATGAAMLGLEVKLACHWDIGVEGGARYQSRLNQDNSDFHQQRFFDGVVRSSLIPFRPVNDNAGDRWTVPVTGYVKFRF
jgi:hypothetical protein